MRRSTGLAAALAAGGMGLGVAGTWVGLVTGAFSVDLGVGRRVRPLGPLAVEISAPREIVFDVVAQPYLGRATRAQREKVRVLEQDGDLVLAAHTTAVVGGRLHAVTVETVRFTRPERVDFRLVRGPVPHVVESFVLTERDGATRLAYEGELGTDLWRPGRRWGDAVAARWEATVAESLASVKVEAERRTGKAAMR